MQLCGRSQQMNLSQYKALSEKKSQWFIFMETVKVYGRGSEKTDL